MEAAKPNRTARHDANRTPPAEDWSLEHTRILPEAFEGLDTGKTLNILDTGPADSRTIEFFRRFRCRLHVADLLSSATPSQRADAAREFFGTFKRVRFDLCFLWDYINYPDDEAFADFIAKLSEHVHDKTLLYAIGAYSAELPLKSYRYAIADSGRIAIRPSGGIVPRPRARKDVVKAMRRYMVYRAALRRDNRLELLLRTVRTNWN